MRHKQTCVPLKGFEEVNGCKHDCGRLFGGIYEYMFRFLLYVYYMRNFLAYVKVN